MTLAILGILGALIPFLIWLYQRKATKEADPVQQNAERYEQINHDIAAGKSNPVAASVDLDELERLAAGGLRDNPDNSSGSK